MTGIDVGSTSITHSNGALTPLDLDVIPSDLLIRIARDEPYVRIGDRHVELQSASTLLAVAVAQAISDDVTHASERIALATPGWWSPGVQGQVCEALSAEGLDVTLVNDAEAAIYEHLGQGHSLPETVAVLSVRAGYTSAVIVEQCTSTPRSKRTPTVVHAEGGDQLDILVLQHIAHGLSDKGVTVDPEDEATVRAAREALTQVRTQRELLSVNGTVQVSITLPGGSAPIRFVRAELEQLATPWCDAIIAQLHTLLTQYEKGVDAILLIGGLAHMPLISQRVSADLVLEVIVPDEPSLITARGAARILETLTTPPPRQSAFGRALHGISHAMRMFTRSSQVRSHDVGELPGVMRTSPANTSVASHPSTTASSPHDPRFDDIIAALSTPPVEIAHDVSHTDRMVR